MLRAMWEVMLGNEDLDGDENLPCACACFRSMSNSSNNCGLMAVTHAVGEYERSGDQTWCG